MVARQMRLALLLVLIISLGVTSRLYATFSQSDAGTSTANFLKLGVDARAAAMGNAFTSIRDDATSVYWNPAGLSKIRKHSISFMHALWFEDIFYDWVSYALPLKRKGTAGIGILYLNYGGIQETDDFGVERGVFWPYDLAVTVSYARSISGISLGGSLKYIASKIKNTAFSIALDAGVRYALFDEKLSLGLVVRNLGPGMQYGSEGDPLAMDIKIGLAYRIFNDWLIALDAGAPLANEVGWGIGSEYNYQLNKEIIISGRAGYNTNARYTGGLNGLTAGTGVNYLGYNFDYALASFGKLGITHRFSISLKF